MTLFLSHSHKDQTTARRLADDLRDAGHEVWIDAVNIPLSSLWAEEIERGVKECSHFLALWSPDANASKWVGKEIDMAEKYGKPIIPLLHSGPYEDMPERLKQYQGPALTPNYKDGLADLLGKLPAAPHKSVNVRHLLREGTLTFGEVASRFAKSEYPFGSADDAPVGIPLVRSACGEAFLFGRANDLLAAPPAVQIAMQFTGKQQEAHSFLPQVEAYWIAQPRSDLDAERRVWMVWIRGPRNTVGDYELSPADPAVWADAAKLTLEAIYQATYTPRPLHFFVAAPGSLLLAVGGMLRQKVPMSIYNFNRGGIGDADRYTLVYELNDAV